MQIAVIGVNHKVAGISQREQIAALFTKHFTLKMPFHSGSFIHLATCNRTELYFSGEDLTELHQEIMQLVKPFEQNLYSFFGTDCFSHLVRVTTGIDSAVLFETEIQRQVKLAYEEARRSRLLSKELHFLFQKSLKLAKASRSEPKHDLETTILQTARDHFKEGCPVPLFIGASDINCKIAQFLKKNGVQKIAFSNRSEGVKDQISEFCTHFIPWQDLSKSLTTFDFVLCATKCPKYIIKSAPQTDTKKLLIDLSVPRNIDPSVASETVTLLNMDDIEKRLEKKAPTLFLEEKKKALDANARRQIHFFHKHRSRPLKSTLNM